MSSRPGIIADVEIAAEGGISPNRFMPFVSVHIRAYWPILATDEQIEQALSEAINDARTQIKRKRSE